MHSNTEITNKSSQLIFLFDKHKGTNKHIIVNYILQNTETKLLQ